MNERLDSYENLTNMEVVQRYRLDKGGIDRLNEEYGYHLSPRTLGQRNVSALEKIIVTLRYFASGDFQINDGDIHKLSQPSVSRAVSQLTEILANRETMSRHISFPINIHDVTRVKTDFQGMANFPNVVGVVNGMQVHIQAPHLNEDAYVNRMGFHSINTQLIINGQDRLTDIVARWPVSTHDSRIRRKSVVFQLFELGHVAGDHKYLLGNSGYPCKQWLLTPYLNPANAAQVNYNRAHKITRSKVERGIGQLKRRWGVLHGEIRLKPEKACQVIMACRVLHNICKDMNIPMIWDDIPDNMQQEIPYHDIQNGLRYRDFEALTYLN